VQLARAQVATTLVAEVVAVGQLEELALVDRVAVAMVDLTLMDLLQL
jgi:hypothetical protein